MGSHLIWGSLPIVLVIFCCFWQKSEQIWHQNEITTKPPNQLDSNWYQNLQDNSGSSGAQNGVVMHHNYSRTISYQSRGIPSNSGYSGVKGGSKHQGSQSANYEFVNEYSQASNYEVTTSKYIQRIPKKHQFTVLNQNANPILLGSTVETSTDAQGYLECPYGATGLFAYALDCKQFLNCFKGRGSIQNCAGGSAFNPNSKECDYPDKVQCTAYKSQSDIFQQKPSGNLFQTMFSDRSVLAQLHAAASTLSKQFVCPRGANGLFAHPNDCKFYWRCDNGKNHLEQCAPGTLFNPVISLCDYARNVHCETVTENNYQNVDQSNSNSEVFEDSTDVGNSGIKESGYQRSYRRQNNMNYGSHTKEIKCPNGFSGLRPHPSDCTKFLNCDNGKVYIQDCGPGTHFDPRSLNCGWPHVVNCAHDSRVHNTNQENIFQQSGHTEDSNSEYISASGGQNFGFQGGRGTETPRHSHHHGFGNHHYGFDKRPGFNTVTEPEHKHHSTHGTFFNGHSYGTNSGSSSGNWLVPDVDESQKPETNTYNYGNTNRETTTQQNYQGFMEHFIEVPGHRLRRHDVERYSVSDANTCAKYCLSTKFYQCKSFSYRSFDRNCILSDAVVGDTGDMVLTEGFMYYEHKNHSVKCDNMFTCDNKKCINNSEVCNKEDNCGDNSDEKECESKDVDFKIRLTGSTNNNEGRLEVQAFGRWGNICDDSFDIRDANIACKELGFPLGAVEVRHNVYNTGTNNLENTNKQLILMDNVQCLGNETSLQFCNFNGWGIHNCKPEEVVGVVCKTPTVSCPGDYWLCRKSMECIPLPFLCDGVEDCDDKTDEKPEHCESKFQVRLINGSAPLEGRVEVRHLGVWGTVCDDDFNDEDATVICNALGYKGPSRAGRGGEFGPGKGPIWLDELMCNGNESSLEKCLHNDWGTHNCDHSEDAVVYCSRYERPNKKVPPGGIFPHEKDENKLTLSDVLPSSCGLRADAIIGVNDDVQARVVAGSVATKGHYPWQASLRVKGQGKTSHWCGAVIITPLHILSAAHCLLGFHKGTYVVRAGDYETEIDEGTEQEAYIEEYYIHEQFRQGGHHMNNDIALVKLKGSGFQLGGQVRAICLPELETNYTTGLNCTISGWGSTQSGRLSASLQLRSGWVPIQSQEVCRQPHIYGSQITDGMFCAGNLEEGVDTCDGDSGGPLVCLNYGLFTLYGLTSFGQHCGYANKPGVYVNVGHYRSWIDNTIERSLK